VCNALELRRELTPGIAEWAGDLKNSLRFSLPTGNARIKLDPSSADRLT
jgi:hypothetical protein